MNAQTRVAGWLRTQLIYLRAAWATFRISIFYIIGCYLVDPQTLRKKGDTQLHWWSNCLLKGVKLTYTIENQHYLLPQPQQCQIIMSNHSSMYDIPLIILAGKKNSIRMITKKELFRVPLWGRALRISEFIPMDRSNNRAALQQLKYAKQKMKSGITLWISPEGTRSPTGELLPFKNGGFKLAKATGATIIPIAISHSNLIHQKRRFRLGLHCTVHICPPINPKEYTNIQELRAAVRQQIQQAIKTISQNPTLKTASGIT